MGRILIVEDELYQRELYAEELIDSGYEIEQASNGKEALDLIDKKSIDLIIMDLRIAEMDGIEAFVKNINEQKKIPVIIYTAYSDYKSNFMNWTADAYLTKSSNLDKLKIKIAELLAC